MNAGAGIALRLTLMTLYVEARYDWAFTRKGITTCFPIAIGLTFSGILSPTGVGSFLTRR